MERFDVIPSEAISNIPAPMQLTTRLIGLTVLDAILSGEPDGRLIVFYPDFNVENPVTAVFDTEMGAWARFYLSRDFGLIIGFSAESNRNPIASPTANASLETIPTRLQVALSDPELYIDGKLAATFALSWQADEMQWKDVLASSAVSESSDDGGLGQLVSPLMPGSEVELNELLSGYYELQIDPADIASILALAPIGDADILRINPEADLTYVRSEISTTRYSSG